MADDADVSDVKETLILDASIQHITARAASMPKGEPGNCGLCGEPSLRLVRNACARCRDKRHLP